MNASIDTGSETNPMNSMKWSAAMPCLDDADVRSFGVKLKNGQRIVHVKKATYWIAMYRVDNPSHPQHGKLWLVTKEV